MSPAAQKVVSLSAGLAALVFLVWADIAGYALGVTTAGMLGMLAGAAIGMLVPSPGQHAEIVQVLREGTKAIVASAEAKASESNEALPR